MLVDTLGLLLVVMVSAASVQDRDGAKLVLEKAHWRFASLKLVWADGSYAGQLIKWVKERCLLVLEIIKRSDKDQSFKVQARRWVVGCSFGWLNRYRRLAKDYERETESSEAMIQLAMPRLMLSRLYKKEMVRRQRQQDRQKQLVEVRRVGFALAD